MKGKDLMNGLNFVEDQYVQEAEFGKLKKSNNIDYNMKGARLSMKKKSNWKAGGAIAACLAIAVFIGTAGLVNHLLDSEPSSPSQESEIVPMTDYLDIYYLSENGTIESKSIEVSYTAENIFNEWAALNGVSDVTLVECVYDNGGSEQQQGGMVEYTPGNYFKLNLTVSSKFAIYAESETGDLLVESLRRTFRDYLYYDEFNLFMKD